jgi:hypothetical protein
MRSKLLLVKPARVRGHSGNGGEGQSGSEAADHNEFGSFQQRTSLRPRSPPLFDADENVTGA